eukprot:780742-Pyramimonas_sp.AAC.1
MSRGPGARESVERLRATAGGARNCSLSPNALSFGVASNSSGDAAAVAALPRQNWRGLQFLTARGR